MPLCDRNKKIFGRCQKMFDTWEPTRHQYTNYALAHNRSMSKSSFSESNSGTNSPQTVILRYNNSGCRQKDVKYCVERRARSRSAAPGYNRNNKHRDYSWVAARSRHRSSSPRHRYHSSQHMTQTHTHKRVVWFRVFQKCLW